MLSVEVSLVKSINLVFWKYSKGNEIILLTLIPNIVLIWKGGSILLIKLIAEV